MSELLYVVVGLLMLAGLAGALLPILPGTPLILVGAAIYAFATDFTPIGWGRLVILAALAIFSVVVGSLGTALGTRGAGGSHGAVIGAILGTLVGVAFAPLGLIVGPLVGAVGAEWLRTGRLRESVRSGIGAVIGTLAGAVMHFAVALAMVALFVWWAVRG
jgi:uncharacterized protein YqgC (DUF456 family)